MTTQEFSNEFDLMYDNASGNAPGINLYEKSVFLTLAQEEIVKETYSGYTQSRVGFEGSERRRRQLSELVGDYKTTTRLSNFGGPGTILTAEEGSEQNLISSSQFFGLPDDLLYIVLESVTLGGTNSCLNGKKIKVRPDDFKRAKAGATSFVETEKSGKKRPANRFLNKQNIESNKLAEKIRLGKIKDKAQLRNDPDYKKIQSNDIKNKLIQVLVSKGGDASYKPVEKKVVEKKSAGSFAPEKLAKIKKGAGAGTSRGPDGVIQIQEPLLVDKKTLDHARRTMSQRGFLQAFPGYKYASGGLVNARNGAFVEVQNRFSDRMLPGKKRTTRIY